jgi:tripartite-type tricarboxylate transporter receptor subunit TctC
MGATHTRRAVLAGGAMLFAPHVLAQEKFPSRTMTWVVPFPAGGTTDLVARMVQPKFQEFLGVQTIIETKAGAGGSIGAAEAAKAAPDGYTRFCTTSPSRPPPLAAIHRPRQAHIRGPRTGLARRQRAAGRDASPRCRRRI